MSGVHLKSVDLNLLTVFNAIYDYGQVTRAADALGLTQPAVSHALRRLRVMLGDELFIRSNARMEPTPRAHEVAGPISEILRNVQKVMDETYRFDPAMAKREVRIGMLDYGIAYFAARIAKFIGSEAPTVQIDFRHTETGLALEMIEKGSLDLGIGPFDTLSRDYRKSLLQRGDFVIVARQNHPSISGKLTMENYSSLDHVRFSNFPAIDDQIEEQLQHHKLRRRIVMTVPHYSSALFAVSTSDLVATITRGPASLFKDFLGLELYEPPFELEPNEISIVRHRRNQDPLIEWMWNRIVALQD